MKLIWRYTTLLLLLIFCYFAWKLTKTYVTYRTSECLQREDITVSESDWFNLTCQERECVIGQKLCRPQCEYGYFSLPGSQHCIKWLTCDQIKSNIQIQKRIGHGAVKQVYLGEWHGYPLVYCNLTTLKYKEDFDYGVEMMTLFASSVYVVQLLGHCDSTVVLEYHQLQSLEHIDMILNMEQYQKFNTALFRLQLCINYVKIIHFLHSSPHGVHVMCDSNDLNKTLSQFLVKDDLTLIVSDLDAIPVLNTENKNIKCGHRQLFGDFVAPEQLWPYSDKPFNDNDMPGYSEKIDIWKIPNVADFILGHVTGSDIIRFHLFSIHRQCKQTDPTLRPSAQQIIHEYQLLYQTLSD